MKNELFLTEIISYFSPLSLIYVKYISFLMFYTYIHYLYTYYKKLYLSTETNEKQLLTYMFIGRILKRKCKKVELQN